ncbi:hypothetical protein K0U07_01635 [bacterium]|nr:hypothetical protein [bacterium]
MRIAENLKAYSETPDAYDAINIVVDGSPKADLTFPGLNAKLEEVLALEKKVCLELFLDLFDKSFSFADPLQFSIRKKALEELLNCIPEEAIHHIILFRGPLDFTSHIKKNAQVEEEYELWKQELESYQIEEEHLLHLFSAKLLSDFFHSLCSILPDSIKGVLLFSIPSFLEIGKVAELLSEETFSHLEVGIKNPKYFLEGICWGNGAGLHHLSYRPSHITYTEEEVKTAVVLPLLGDCDYKCFEKMCHSLIEKKIPFKIIEENLLNEKWFQIDTIYYDEERTSFDGKRMIDGFIAAGGTALPFSTRTSSLKI